MWYETWTMFLNPKSTSIKLCPQFVVDLELLDLWKKSFHHFRENIWPFFFLTKLYSFCSASSKRNKAAFAVVAEAVYNDFGGEEQCPWSPAQLRG